MFKALVMNNLEVQSVPSVREEATYDGTGD